MAPIDLLVDRLAEVGVRRVFGIPGGGPGLDLIEAARQRGIEFVLARDETAAVIMASSSAEISGTIGVALTGRGPGLANAINGIAHADLDRTPVLVVTDAIDPQTQGWISHQSLDQPGLVAPITRAAMRLGSGAERHQIDALIARASRHPKGPVLLEVCGAGPTVMTHDTPETLAESRDDPAAAGLLQRALKPVIIAGLDALEAAPAVRRMAQALNCPVLTTYKARGVVATDDPRSVGLFTGGSAESECAAGADLLITVGLDPVELIPQPWRYCCPVLDISPAPYPRPYVKPDASLHGDITAGLERLSGSWKRSDWATGEITGLRRRMEAHLDRSPSDTVAYDARLAVERAQALAPAGHRITVDAGAHMIPVMAWSRARSPRDVLISNGLATMAFALPAGIAAALEEPERIVVAFTGDGGLMMCLGELATAVQQRARLVVVALNDATLSLIDIKQRSKGFERIGVNTADMDLASVMTALGGAGYTAVGPASYANALSAAFRHVEDHASPALIDAKIDPRAYSDQLRALRSEAPGRNGD